MRMTFAVAALVLAHGSTLALAEPSNQLVGTWAIKSYKLQAVGEDASEPFGKRPKGSLAVTAEGRWIILISGNERKVATTDADRAALLQSMIAYTGRYRIEGDHVATEVDASWNEVYSGDLRTQARTFRVDGDVLTLNTGLIDSAVRPGKKVSATLTFERER